jgi:hypothetical protein
MQPLTIELKLHLNANYIVVRPLDPLGNPGTASKTYFPLLPNLFELTIDQSTEKTVWFGIDAFGDGITSVTDPLISKEYVLLQNYPNPFTTSTTITFKLPERSFVNLKVSDLHGREVANLVSEELSAGTHSRVWDSPNIPDGIYFYRLETKDFNQTKKLIYGR